MRFHQILLGAVVFFTGCSSQKYAYQFDQYDYNSGRKNASHISEKATEGSPLVMEQLPTVTASSSAAFEPQAKTVPSNDVAGPSPGGMTLKERYTAMSKSEQKDFKKTLKKELKTYAKKISKGEEVQSVKAVQKFDTLSGLAILFGGAGIVMIMLASISNIFWILGAISLVIGAFFFVKWVSNGNG